MASDIVSEARQIAVLMEAFLEEPSNQAKARALADRTKALRKQLGPIVNNPTGPKAREVARELLPAKSVALETAPKTESVSKRPAAAAKDQPQEMGIESFFQQVSDSLVTTQARLNEVSLDYVRHLDPRIAPAYFAIPTLKAELKVGFQSTKGGKLNLVLFSRRQDRKDYGESTVSFELAAAPPPPGEAPFGELSVPTPRYLTLGQTRRRLLDETRRIAQEQEGTSPLGKTFENTEESGLALVLRSEPSREDRAANRERYLVIWPSQQTGTKNPHLWQEIVLMPLVEDPEGVRLAPQSRLDAQSRPVAGSLLRIARNDDAAPGEPAAVVNELGHALNRMALAIRDGSPAKRLTDALP